MRKLVTLSLVALLGGLGSFAVVGCDDTISHKESSKTSSDGTTVTKEETVKEKPDGTIVKEESKEVDKSPDRKP